MNPVEVLFRFLGGALGSDTEVGTWTGFGARGRFDKTSLLIEPTFSPFKGQLKGLSIEAYRGGVPVVKLEEVAVSVLIEFAARLPTSSRARRGR